MEYAIGLTGIGGQGIQLAARSLAEAALSDGRRVQMFASYGGMMRGGNSDSFVVLADQPITSPPTPGRLHAAVVMHHAHAADLWPRLRADSVAIVNASVVPADPSPPTEASIVEVRALDEAEQLGAPMAASLVALGALVAHTGVVTVDALLDTVTRVLPSYRTEAIESNRAALVIGVERGSLTHRASLAAT